MVLNTRWLLVLMLLLPADEHVQADVRVILRDGKTIQADGIVDGPETLTLVVEAAGIRLSRSLPRETVIRVETDAARPVSHSQPLLVPPTEPAFSPAEIPMAVPCVPPLVVEHHWLQPPWPVHGLVIGVRDDPLSAYRHLLPSTFPNGVPLSEVGFARDVLRERVARDLLCGSAAPVPLGTSPLGPPSNADRQEVSRLVVRAWPVNRRGVDWEALTVELFGYGADEQPVPLRGTLQVTLRGQRQRLVPSYGSRLLTDVGEVRELARWTEVLEPKAFRITPARVVLPLPRPLPDHDLSIAAHGDLHVRLSVPGQGTLEAIQPFVPLRQAGPVRERNVIEGNSLFFETESTSDNPRRLGRSLLTSGLEPRWRIFGLEP